MIPLPPLAIHMTNTSTTMYHIDITTIITITTNKCTIIRQSCTVNNVSL